MKNGKKKKRSSIAKKTNIRTDAIHRVSSWLALGDSYTIGEGVPPEERWPTQLAQQFGFAAPEYLAETGWTTVDLLEAIAKTNFANHYDWVSVQIGVNDQYDGLGREAYREGLSQVIDFAVSKVTASHRVVVLSIPDYSVTPFGQDHEPQRIAREVALFNTIAREIAVTKQTTYCDITPLSQQALNDRTLLVEDGLHPSAHMYRLWVAEVVNHLR